MHAKTGTALTLLTRDRATGRIGKPEPKQMTLAGRFRPVLVFASRMQGHEIVEELDIAGCEANVDRTLIDHLSIERNSLRLSRRKRRHAGKLLRLEDGGTGAGSAEVSVDEREDRLLEPWRRTRIHLAGMGAIKIFRQHLREIRTPLEEPVVDRDRACDPAFASALCALQAQQPDIVAGIGVEQHFGASHVAASVRIGVIAAEILHMTKNVPLPILRHGLPEIASQAEIGDRLLLAIEAIDRKALQHDNAATVQQLAANIPEDIRKTLERKIAAADSLDRDTTVTHGSDRGAQLIDVAIRESVAPGRHIAEIGR